MKNLQNRLKSYPLWVAMGSLLLLVLQNAGVHVVPEQYNEIVNGLLTVLIGFGVINNPSDKDKI